MVMATKKHSSIHIFFSSGTSFLKIWSDTKQTIAIKKLKPTSMPEILMYIAVPLGLFSSSSNQTAMTRKTAETIFNGVSLSFTFFSF